MAKLQKTSMAEIRDAMNLAFKERKSLVDGMLTALIAREMLFLLGPPGTAKSAICEALCQSIGGDYFSWMVSKFTTPEELFGPLSLKALENDKYERVTTNKLPSADVAFIDEIFKGSSAILNTLLPVINERTFYNGATPTKIPLQVLFGASNEIPQAEELAALYDRFALRYCVDRMQQESSMEDLFKNGLQINIPSISIQDLGAEQAKATKLVVPDAVVKQLLLLRKLVHEEGIYVSDRKWVQSIRIVKAFAHLNGHTEVMEDDLEILENVLWSSPEQMKSVRKLVSKVANPLGEQIMKHEDAAQEIYDSLKKGKTPAVEAQKKMKDLVKLLESLAPKKNLDSNPKLKSALAKVRKINMEILKDFLGVENF